MRCDRTVAGVTWISSSGVIAKVLGHVWFSCLVAWRNGVGDLPWVAAELEAACHVLCDHLD